ISNLAGDIAIVGETVVITAVAAADSPDVAFVDFTDAATGQRVSSDSTSPFTHTFTAAATATLTPLAPDFAANPGAPVALTITVNSNAPPLIQLTAPAAGATVASGRTLTVAAQASDDLDLREVELHVTGTQVASAQVFRFGPGVKSGSATFSVPIPAGA